MCEVPRPRWRHAWHPVRVGLVVTAAVFVAAGIAWHTHLGLVALALGVTVLLTAVLFPLVSEVEFGFPVGLKVRAGTNEREVRLRRSFEDQRGNVELCAHVLCGPPETAASLVEAAWARSAATWRGAVTPDLRTYVLCVLVELAGAHLRWVDASDDDAAESPLARLPLAQRIVVVLHDFGGLPAAQIAGITSRPLDDVTDDLRAAERVLAAS